MHSQSSKLTITSLDDRRAFGNLALSRVSIVAVYLGSIVQLYPDYFTPSEQALVQCFLNDRELNQVKARVGTTPRIAATEHGVSVSLEIHLHFKHMYENYVESPQKAYALKQLILSSSLCVVRPDIECRGNNGNTLAIHKKIIEVESEEVETLVGNNLVALRAEIRHGKIPLYIISQKAWNDITQLSARYVIAPTPKKTAQPLQQGYVSVGSRPLPTNHQLRKYYKSQAGFFNASNKIFEKSSDCESTIAQLRCRAKENPGGASDKTLKNYGLK